MSKTEQLLKIARMGWPEISTRVGQKLRIARERVAISRNGSGPAPLKWTEALDASQISNAELRRSVAANDLDGAEAAISDHLRSRETPRFYFVPRNLESMISTYRKAFPDRAVEVVQEAGRLRQRRLRIFAYDEVSCGARIPWRSDVVHGIESGLRHWSKIPYLDFNQVGDSKIVWEPNRHQHLVTLALAALLANDDSYAEECFAELSDWDRENPYLRGINWASSLELAFRAWSWVWVVNLLSANQAFTRRYLGVMLQRVQQHGEFIFQNLSTYFSPNTHLLGEGFGLFVIGTVFPELRFASKFRDTGRRVLAEQILAQVRPDGSHAEQSNYYHRYATDFFLSAAILADLNGAPFPASYRDRLERMIEFTMHTAWPDGTHPMTGDADGGRLLPFGVRDATDNRSVLSTAAIYFGREDFLARAGHLYEETFWLLGEESVSGLNARRGQTPAETSRLFPDAGCAILRSDWSSAARMLQFDGGPQGMDGCGHGHADALSIICAADGRNWIVDPGTFVYTSSREWRDHFRSTAAHNTVLIDELGQAEPADVFKWREICAASLCHWMSTPVFDLACASHQGYARLPEQVVHRRWIAFCKPEYWFLLDEFAGQGDHQFETRFHFHPDAELQVTGRNCNARIGDSNLRLVTSERIGLSVLCGSENPKAGWYSTDYGSRVAAPVLTGRTKTQVPARTPWVLIPGADEDAAITLEVVSGSEWRVRTAVADDRFYRQAPDLSAPPSDLETDAEFAWVRLNENEEIRSIAFVGGSRLNLDKATGVSANVPLRNFCYARNGARAEIWMQPEAAVTIHRGSVSEATVNGHPRTIERNGDSITIRAGH